MLLEPLGILLVLLTMSTAPPSAFLPNREVACSPLSTEMLAISSGWIPFILSIRTPSSSIIGPSWVLSRSDFLELNRISVILGGGIESTSFSFLGTIFGGVNRTSFTFTSSFWGTTSGGGGKSGRLDALPLVSSQ